MQVILMLIGYTILMVALTLTLTKRSTTAENLNVGNRNMGLFSSAMSIAATWIWAPALFVSAEQAYTHGLPGLFWFLVPNIACLLLFIPFAKRIRELMPYGTTLAEYMGKKYGSTKVKNIYVCQLSLLTVLSTAVQLLAGGTIISSLTGIPFVWVTAILCAVAFSYAHFSGIRASVITDTVQMIIMLAICVLFVPWALSSEGDAALVNGLSGITGEFDSLFSANGIEVFLSFGLPTAIGLIAGPFGDQCFWQRAFSIRKNSIGRAFILGAIVFAVVPISMGILGYIAAGSGFVPSNTGYVNLEFVTHLFPTWATLPFLFMLISGLLSTIDSNMCAVSSLSGDLKVTGKLKNPEKLRVSRLSMIVMMLLGMLIANVPGVSITHLFLIYGTLRATTLLTTAMTIKGKELTENGVFIGILAAVCLGLPLFAYGTINDLSPYKTMGSLVSVLTGGVIALIISKLEVSRNVRQKTKHQK